MRELSLEVHVSDSSLSRYFAGQALPPWEVVAAMADLGGGHHDSLRRLWEGARLARKQSRWPSPSPCCSAPVPGGSALAGKGATVTVAGANWDNVSAWAGPTVTDSWAGPTVVQAAWAGPTVTNAWAGPTVVQA